MDTDTHAQLFYLTNCVNSHLVAICLEGLAQIHRYAYTSHCGTTTQQFDIMEMSFQYPLVNITERKVKQKKNKKKSAETLIYLSFPQVTSLAFKTHLNMVKATTSGMASSHSVTGSVYLNSINDDLRHFTSNQLVAETVTFSHLLA